MHNEIKEAWRNCITLYLHPGKFTVQTAEKSGAARRMINRFMLPILSLASIPAFFVLSIDYIWYIAAAKTIINFIALYIGAWSVLGIACYYVTNSPLGNSRESYMAPLIINGFTLFIIPISLFYANEMHIWRFIAGAIAIFYSIRITIAGTVTLPDIEQKIKFSTIILICVTTVTFPFLIQRILNLLFNLPIS